MQLRGRLISTARGVLGRLEAKYRAFREPPRPPVTTPAPPIVEAPPPPKQINWELRSQAELVDHIVGHYHAGVRRDLPRLLAAARGASPRVPEGLTEALETIGHELEGHMAKEERVLFPALRTGQRGGAVDMPIRMMEREHEGHDDLLAQIRAATNDLTLPSDAPASWQALYEELRAFETALREHVYLEEHVLFARGLGGES
ncbi:MAG: hemerythrin domain-containing protein [Myxococcales bacterium]|nr:hemerythrin domain-containing protein [Myxococcales bacterium]